MEKARVTWRALDNDSMVLVFMFSFARSGIGNYAIGVSSGKKDRIIV
jgi:hypothetical protein